MQRVRDKYGSGPPVLRVPGQSLALILDPAHSIAWCASPRNPSPLPLRKSGQRWPTLNRRTYSSHKAQSGRSAGGSITRCSIPARPSIPKRRKFLQIVQSEAAGASTFDGDVGEPSPGRQYRLQGGRAPAERPPVARHVEPFPATISIGRRQGL